MADYATLKVPELKKLLQEEGLTIGGNKAELIARLKEHDGPDAAGGDAAAATGTGTAAAAPAAAAPGKTLHNDHADEVVSRSRDDSTVCAPAHDGDSSHVDTVSQEGVSQEGVTTATTDNPAAAEDEIDYSDDEVKIKTSRSTQQADAPAPAAAAPAAEQTPTAADGETAADASEPADAEAPSPEAPKQSFALNLPTTQADEEARRRAERAKRFGTDTTQDDDTLKRADRTARFGLGDNAVTGLDSALSDGRPPKRGRPQGRDGDERAAKRQSTDRNGAGRHGGGGGRGGRHSTRHNQGSSSSNNNRAGGNQGGKKAAADPEEKKKADERKKRFAAAS